MPSGSVNSVDLVLSIAILVMSGVKGGGGSVGGLILLCVLSISLFAGSCGSRDIEE